MRLPLGTNTLTLKVKDAAGHVAQDTVVVIVFDGTPPNVAVDLSPRTLWPANHRMVNIQATVRASDFCGSIVDLKLLSIVSNQPDDATGDGHSTKDIAANVGTSDQSFQLRAERSGNTERTYTVTYQVTDASGNRAHASAEVVVPRAAESNHELSKPTIASVLTAAPRFGL